jgi:hypothetical protein
MEKNSRIGLIVKAWCDCFEQEARILRDIDKGVQVIDGNGEKWRASELWLRRNTDLLNRYPIVLDESGQEYINIEGILSDSLLERPEFVKAKRRVRFPHTEYTTELDDDEFLVKRWCQEFKQNFGPLELLVWQHHPEGMAAAERLIRMTGLVVSDDMAVESCAAVL